MEKETTYKHPSYGQLEINRVQAAMPHPLYGSSIKHRDTIRIRLYESSMKRMLNRDWHHTGRTIFEIEMSQSQWAEFVCAAGIGGGVPCTIRYIQGQEIEEPPFISKRAEFDGEFDDSLETVTQQITDAIKEADTLLEKPTVTKGDRKKIRELLYFAKQNLQSNLPFIKRSFTEQMDKTVNEAKGEVEAWSLNKVVTDAKQLAAMRQEALEAGDKGDLPSVVIE